MTSPGRIGAPPIRPRGGARSTYGSPIADLRAAEAVAPRGIRFPQAARVAAAYAPYLDNVEQVARDGWARLAGSRKAG
jgi:hypothetical protein